MKHAAQSELVSFDFSLFYNVVVVKLSEIGGAVKVTNVCAEEYNFTSVPLCSLNGNTA